MIIRTLASRVLVALGVVAAVASFAEAQIIPRIGAPTDPDAILLNFTPEGDLWISQPEESTRGITTLEIISESGSFNPIPCPLGPLCGGLFDVWGGPNNNKIFRLFPEGFSELHVEGVLRTPVEVGFLVNDLKIDGSMVGGGTLPEVVIPIPEPTGLIGPLTGVALAFVNRRRRPRA